MTKGRSSHYCLWTKLICGSIFILVITSSAPAHDVNGNGKEGLAEAIHSLQVAAGFYPGSGPAGNASPNDVLEGVTFSTATEIGLTGTMVNNGAFTTIPSTSDQTIPEGYHNGLGTVKGDINLIDKSIRKGTSIFGVSGSVGVFWGCSPESNAWHKTDCLRYCNEEFVTSCDDFCDNLITLFGSYPSAQANICGGAWEP